MTTETELVEDEEKTLDELLREARRLNPDLTREDFVRSLRVAAVKRGAEAVGGLIKRVFPKPAPDVSAEQARLDKLRPEPAPEPESEAARNAKSLRQLKGVLERLEVGKEALGKGQVVAGQVQREREEAERVRRGVPLGQLPLTEQEQAAVERGELGGPAEGPSIAKLGIVAGSPLVVGLIGAGAPALAAKLPVLSAFLLEGVAEETGLIPGRPVGRAIEFVTEPMKRNLEDLGVPEGAAGIISELVMMGAIGKAPTGQRTAGELFTAARNLSKEDVAKTLDAVKNVVVRGEAGRVRLPGARLPEGEPGVLMPKVAPLEEVIALGEAFERDIPRRIGEMAAKVPIVRGGISLLSGASARARGKPLAEAWIAWNRTLESTEAAVKVGMSHVRKLGNPFKLGKGGQVLGIKVGFPDGWTGPKTRHISDVMQWWGVAYKGTAEQTRFVRRAWRLLDEAVARYEAVGGEVRKLGVEKVGGHWFPRQVFSKRGIDLLNKAARGGGLGGKPRAATRPRIFEFAEQGVRNGIDYNNDPLAVLETTLNAIGRATVDQQLINVAARQGRTALSLVSTELKAVSARSGQQYRWADRVLGYAKGSVRGRPSAPVLRGSRIYGEPSRELLEIVDGIKAANELTGAARKTALAGFRNRAETIRNDSLRAWNEARTAVRTQRETMAGAGVLPGAAFGRAEEAIAVQQVGRQLPGLGGKIFTAEDADFLLKHWADLPGPVPRTAAAISGVVRFGQTAIDPGFWLIQGLGPLGYDLANLARGRPTAIWAKGVYRSLEALVTAKGHQAYLANLYRKNPARMERFARYVGGISWSEYTEAAREGGLLMKVPIVRPVARKAAQFFDGYLNVAMLETWGAVEGLARGNPKKLEQLGAFVRNLSGTLSARRLGQTPTQQMVEGGFLLYAPRYRRAGIALTIDAMRAFLEPTSLRARESLAGLAGIAAATHAMYIGTAKATGMSDEDIIEGLKPWSGGKHLSVQIGGRNIGIGGVHRSVVNTIGRLARTTIESPDDFLNWMPADWNDNPLLRVGRSQGAPGPGIAYDVLSGETYLGEPIQDWSDLGMVGEELLPFWLSAGLDGEGDIWDRALGATAEFMGLRAYPVNPWQQMDHEIDGMGFMNSLGEPLSRYRDLTLPQKIEAEERNEEIKNLLVQAEKRGRGVYAEINTLSKERIQRLEWAAFTLESTGPSQDSLRRYADSIKNTKADIAGSTNRAYERAGVDAREDENADLKIYHDFLEHIAPAVAPDGLIDGETYGQLSKDFRDIVGPKVTEEVLNPQLTADRDPQVQQWEKWDAGFSDSGYYDLPEGKERLRFREMHPEWDAIGYLMGRFSSFRTRDARNLVKKWFPLWMRGDSIRVP